jgi:hypothetical protein
MVVSTLLVNDGTLDGTLDADTLTFGNGTGVRYWPDQRFRWK